MKLADSLVLLGVAALPLAAPLADEVAPKPRPPVVILGRDVMVAQDAPPKQEAKQETKQDEPPKRALLRERALEPDEAPPQDEAQRALRRFDHLFDDPRLRELHERLLQRFEELFREGDPFAEALRNQATPRLELQRHGSHLELGPGSSYSREVDSDGRKESVKITVDADGRAKAVVEKDGVVSNYEADSFETLKQEHPEIVEGFGEMRFAFRLPAPAMQPPARNERMELPRRSLLLPRAVRPPQAPQTPQTDDGPRLGVHVEPVDPKVAEYLELEEGVGLRVIEVVPDSAADSLGILKNDLVLEVNGRTIRGVADVQAALKDQDPTQADVTVLRKGVKREL